MKVFIVTAMNADDHQRVMGVFRSRRDAEDSIPLLKSWNVSYGLELWDIEECTLHDDALTGPPKRSDSLGGG